MKKAVFDLKKGDAYGFMKTLSEQTDDLILVLENVTQIQDGDPAIYDDKHYVENLMIRSWKNDSIIAGDLEFDWKRFTIIMTCPPEDREILMKHCRMLNYDSQINQSPVISIKQNLRRCWEWIILVRE